MNSLDTFLDSLGIEIFTKTMFEQQRLQLEAKFLANHGVAPTAIEQYINSSEENDLTDQWIALMSLAPDFATPTGV